MSLESKEKRAPGGVSRLTRVTAATRRTSDSAARAILRLILPGMRGMSADSGPVELLLNGQHVPLSSVLVQTTLLDFLRDRGLTGAKEGCAEGECGACTVLIVTHTDAGTAYRPVNSCLLFAPMMAGREIYTVEALARGGELSGAQSAMAAAGGSQCGYCTPGFVMSLFAEYYRPGREGLCDPHAMGGNLCRCTGYRPIRDAALSLGAPPDGEFLRRLSDPVPPVEPLRYESADSSFLRPGSLEECIALAKRDPETKWIAGGTDVAVESNLRFRRWPRMASLEGVAELREFANGPARVRIGAGLPLTDIAERWADAPEAFRQWIPQFASPALRNRATLGGNLGTASPIGDAPPLLIALGAEVHLAGPDGRRSLPVESFFTGYRRTAAVPGELMCAVEIPKPHAAFTRFYKVAKRRMDDISTVAAAMAIDTDTAGRVTHARFAFGGVAAVPLRAVAVEEAVMGRVWNLDAVHRAQAALDRLLAPISDHRGSAEYRKEAAKSLVEKFWWERAEVAA
jgi:xanthine dehydrogenase small subunit